jgi:two-component system chemotaxis response regulator CheB
VVIPGDRLPLVVIGGSAGAHAPLMTIVRALPSDLGAAVCVVIHIPDDSPSELASILARAGRLQAEFANDDAPLRPGTIAVATPGHHLLVHDGHLRLSPGARENGSRPAIDPLLRTAARARGADVVSVVLSGTLDDGSAGTMVVRRAGGVTIAQDPDDALFGDMPRNAIATGAVMEILPATAIGPRIVELVDELTAGGGAGAGADADPPGRVVPEPPGDHPPGNASFDTVDRGLGGKAPDLEPPASPYSCPDCGGVLFERPADQYLCRLGHRYSPAALGAAQEEVVEDALWIALRTLQESASLSARVRDRATARGDRAMAHRFEARRAGAEARASRIRRLLAGGLDVASGDMAPAGPDGREGADDERPAEAAAG